MYKQSFKKIEGPTEWTNHLMSTHPIVFITTIGKVNNNLICGVAPIATCLDTSYNPPYITFSTAVKQHSLVDSSTNKRNTNTFLNIKENGLFIVNIPSKRLLEKLDVLAYPNNRQNYKDKIDEARLTKSQPFKLSLENFFPPLIEECLAHIECKVIDIHKPKGSDHYNITGKVISVSYDKSLGKKLDQIKVNLTKEIFHHFGSSEDKKQRYIGSIEISKKKNHYFFN